MNAVVAGFEDKIRIGVHICRGNWSKREDVLLSGSYAPLIETLRQMRVRQHVLEFATPRAGDLAIVGAACNDREIGLGVVNPRTDEAEAPEQIVQRCEEALQFWKPEQIFLNPDCGFGCFANRCVNEEEIAAAKLRSMVAAARRLRELS